MVQKIIEKVKAECKAQGEDVDRRGYTKHYSNNQTVNHALNASYLVIYCIHIHSITLSYINIMDYHSEIVFECQFNCFDIYYKSFFYCP